MAPSSSTNAQDGTNSINSLSEFLLQAHTQHLVFDMGRGLKPITNQLFFEWENQQSACFYPRQDHAWFCITFWNEKLSSERYIWFIKLPLDENGLVMPAARDQFLDIIVQALGKNLEHRQDENAQLPENPFVFVPSQQQLADCNAHIKKHLGLNEPTNSAITAYLSAPNVQAWEHLKLQDIANFVCNSTPEQQNMIASNIHIYPNAVANCLLASFEAIDLTDELINAIIALHKRLEESALSTLCLRAISYQLTPVSSAYITELIKQTSKLDVESLVVISGRYWAMLSDIELLLTYADKVASIDNDYSFFRAIFADLVKIPEIRQDMLALLRNTERSAQVAAAICSLFAAQH
jgi:hypothetical protein